MPHSHLLIRIALLLLLPALPGAAAAQQTHAQGPGHRPPVPAEIAPSPYAGQQSRPIKALSAEEVRDLRKGAGMGLAKAAELNRYPGPRHVLDLAAPLGLSAEQRAATEAVFATMRARAVALGESVLALEGALDVAFVGGTIDRPELERLTGEIGRLQGELRAVHLGAHLETRELLTPAQVDAYDRLRGYAGGHGAH